MKRENKAKSLAEDKFIPDAETCPARCKRSGKCYGTAYFDGKAGKALQCIRKKCPWREQLKKRFFS
jgi:hypothetical protein